MIIRSEEPKVYHRLKTLARDVFWNLYFPWTDIHSIKALSFIVEVEGKVQGVIFYTRSFIEKKEETSQIIFEKFCTTLDE